MDTGSGQTQQSFTEQVAVEIRVALARRGIRQAELAKLLGRNDQWLSVRVRGLQPIDLNDLAEIAAGLGVPVAELLPSSARDIFDVEEIRSRPLRSRPARHPRSRVKLTDDYPSRPARRSPTDPIGRPPNRPGAGRPKGRPEKSLPDPATRRPARLPSPAVDMIGASRTPDGNYSATTSRQGRTALPVRSGAQTANDSRHD